MTMKLFLAGLLCPLLSFAETPSPKVTALDNAILQSEKFCLAETSKPGKIRVLCRGQLAMEVENEVPGMMVTLADKASAQAAAFSIVLSTLGDEGFSPIVAESAPNLAEQSSVAFKK